MVSDVCLVVDISVDISVNGILVGNFDLVIVV